MISIVFPIHNEAEWLEGALAKALADLRALGGDFEILLAENGSRDDTLPRAEALAGGESENVRVISLPWADYGAALKMGLSAARGDVRVAMDMDGWSVDFARDCLRLIDDGADVVVGDKLAGADTRPLPRRLVTRANRTFVGALFPELSGLDTHGPIGFSSRAELVLYECKQGGDVFKAEFLIRAVRAGLSVRSVPVSTNELRPARTSLAARTWSYLRGLRRLRKTI